MGVRGKRSDGLAPLAPMKSLFLVCVCVTLTFQLVLTATCATELASSDASHTDSLNHAPLNPPQHWPVSEHVSSHCTCSDLLLTTVQPSPSALEVSHPLVLIASLRAPLTLQHLIDPPPRAFIA